MTRSWYTVARECTALRKHMLRIDLRVVVDSVAKFSNPNDMDSAIKSMLTAAIIKGLDIIGIVNASGPETGWRAWQLNEEQGLDLYVIPGQEYVCFEGETILVYRLRQALPPKLPLPQACEQAHKLGGWVMLANVGKRKAKEIEKLVGTPQAPDAIEIFNSVGGGYLDVDMDLPHFVSSGASSANELEQRNIFTLKNRKELEAMGLIPQGEGVDYTPGYLQKDEEIQAQQVAPGAGGR